MAFRIQVYFANNVFSPIYYKSYKVSVILDNNFKSKKDIYKIDILTFKCKSDFYFLAEAFDFLDYFRTILILLNDINHRKI